jgi:hypothetical protein
LRFFLLLVEAAVFFFGGVLFADVDLDVALFDSPVSTEGWDWAGADDSRPDKNREKNPAKHATAKRRTQTLPTAESWHP